MIRGASKDAPFASAKRTRGLFKDLRPKGVYVLSSRPSFTGDGKTDDSEYALYLWQKPCPMLDYTNLYWYDWKNNNVSAL